MWHYWVTRTPESSLLASRQAKTPEVCALWGLSQGLCLGESLPRRVSGIPSLSDAPSDACLPLCPLPD